MPKVSVVIPCFNQGRFIGDAVDSVLAQTYQDFEILIVNDGSTDTYTNNILLGYHNPKISLITTTNQGLPSARNNGINAAAGEYILPLDADDRIGRSYLEEAVKVLDSNSSVGVVYCEAEFFGHRLGKWRLPRYTSKKILMENIIFCSAMFRKVTWSKIGGYNPNMKYGLEDWDFWLSTIESGIQVYQIPKILFYYRIKEHSMISGLANNSAQLFSMYLQVMSNHKELFLNNLPVLYASINRFVTHYKIPVKSILFPNIRNESILTGKAIASVDLSKENEYSATVVLKRNCIGDISQSVYKKLFNKVLILGLTSQYVNNIEHHFDSEEYIGITVNGKQIRDTIMDFYGENPHYSIGEFNIVSSGSSTENRIKVNIYEIRLRVKELYATLKAYYSWEIESIYIKLLGKIDNEVIKWRI